MKLIDFFAWIGWIKKWVKQAFTKKYGDKSAEDIAFSDIKKESCFIYPKLWNNENNLWDITKINYSELPDFDLFLGWFPCQSYSMVWKRLGLNDERWQLIYNILEILKTKQPKYFFLENVNWILTIDEWRTIQLILEDFKKLWYMVEHFNLNSKDFWVPQSRQRVYFLGIHVKSSHLKEEELKEKLNTIKSKLETYKWERTELSNIIEKDIDFQDYVLNDKEFKMVLLKDSFCWTFKWIDSIANWVTKTYGKVTGQSSKLVYNIKEKRYLSQKEIDSLIKEFKDKSKELKEYKSTIKHETLSERKKKLQDFFTTIPTPNNLIARVFTPTELWRLQGYDDEFIKIILLEKDFLKYQGIASLFWDSVTVKVIEKCWDVILSELNIK